jgi:NaMN:DMB phosphoribosyltransferase
MFSSSFGDKPNEIKERVLKIALSNLHNKNNIFNTLDNVADNMLIFCAGFLMGLNNRYKVILAGGTQMACVLLVMNKILKLMNGAMETSNLALCTTKWVAEDEDSDIEALLRMLSFPINAYYADFDFSLSDHPALKLYDEGEAKEGVGAGGALVYGFLNGVSKYTITKQVEEFLK